MLLAVATPIDMIAPISDGTLNVVCVAEQHPDDADERPGQGRDDDERVEPALEIHDHQQVNEHGGERRGPAPARNALFMLSTWPRRLMIVPAGR